MNVLKNSLFLFVLSELCESVLSIEKTSYKSVVIVHGLLDHPHSMDGLARRIEQSHPGTIVTVLDFLNGWRSLAPIWGQVQWYRYRLQQIMDEQGAIHLIGYSQGGLIARGLLASFSNHTVQTFISLSSPQMGQFGDGGLLKYFFPQLVKEFAYKFFYSLEGQLISIGNYWNDPRYHDMFLNMSAFIPIVNNMVEHPNSEVFKKSFLRLKKLVLIGGPDDGVISPWQSSQFEFYDENMTLVPLDNQSVYLSDSFGLQTLDLSGRLLRLRADGVDHFSWHKNKSIIDNLILPNLD